MELDICWCGRKTELGTVNAAGNTELDIATAAKRRTRPRKDITYFKKKDN